jgi:hypothetical protein
MSAVLLALTLAVASPAPVRPASPPATGAYVTAEGCPASAIGFYRFKPNVRTAWFGILTQDSESYGGNTTAGGMFNGTLRFWTANHRPRAAAVAEVDPQTHELHAIAGTVRKIGDVWCMFSMPEPIPAQYLRDPR